MSKAGEFLCFWIENSIHAAEEYGVIGAEQSVVELTKRCINMAAEQGISQEDLVKQIGDLSDYIRHKLKDANKIENARHRKL